MTEALTLHVIDGDYGLVSLDIECIQSILYAKLCNIPVEISVVSSIKSCALYSAPTLKNGKIHISRVPEILAHVKQLQGSVHNSLSPKQNSESLALTNLVLMKLKPITDFIYWVDQRNCDEFTSRWFMKALSFPFNYSYIKKKRKNATDMIETHYPLDDDLEVIREFITKTATQCLSTLSTRLGNSNYFYGDSATAIDVLVYSYVAPLVKLPFPSNEVVSLMSMWPNLTELIKKIDLKYFPEVKREVKYLKSAETTKQNDDEMSYGAIFIFTLSAVSLLIGFALKRGLIVVHTQ